METVLENKSIKNLNIRALDDLKIVFSHQREAQEVHENNEPVLMDSIGLVDSVNPLNKVEETIQTLENSIDSLKPKVPIVPEKKLLEVREFAKRKLAKRTVREELKDVHYDENPEFANLENTIVLNAEILKYDLEDSKKEEATIRNSNRGKYFVICLFLLLVIFAIFTPFIADFII